ncbi:FISUMP domain-containing protein [Sorangium sp. So ce861]|uniref:FISUMP domain-containing protein n=1 Tax=Sorangium sp. So ce861 TaxID=3133323 RepID=UPI003F5FB09B
MDAAYLSSPLRWSQRASGWRRRHEGTTARAGAAAQRALALSLGIALAACGGGESDTPQDEPSFDGDAGTFTDARDGQAYRWVRIGEQIWTAQNMAYETPEGSWCRGDEPAGCDRWGRHYEAPAAMNACPAGFRLPSDADWHVLETMVGVLEEELPRTGWHGTDAGAQLKARGAWRDSDATDRWGFAAEPAGIRLWQGAWTTDDDDDITSFWTSTPEDDGRWWVRILGHFKDGIYRVTGDGRDAGSVRCVKS